MGRNENIQIELLIETKKFLYKTFDLSVIDSMIPFLLMVYISITLSN